MLFLTYSPIFVLLLHSVRGSTRVDPLVHTKVGLIRGVRASDGNYSMFLGVPYAKVNESNPFGASLPYPHFETVFDAYQDSNRCPQKDGSEITGNLNCLQLNIYVPYSAGSNNMLPVMVYLYGGKLESGYNEKSLYGPKFLVRHDVILIVMNYRVGLYGFMCLHTPEVPGNQGFKDQILALRWIKENINSFGGDDNKITVFGLSAGAKSIDFHLASPQETLFNKVVLESGTSLRYDSMHDPDLEAPIKMTKKLGKTTNSLTEAIHFLATVPPHVAVATAVNLGLVYTPCVEKDFDNIEKFIDVHPVNAKPTKVKGVPVLIGYTNNEQVAKYANQDSEYFNELNLIHDRLINAFNFTEEYHKDMEKIVKHFYMGDMKYNQQAMWKLIDFDSNFIYNHPIERTINKYLDHKADNIFQYLFSYTGNRNYFKDIHNVSSGVGGAAHADEMGYMFDIAMYHDPPTSKDQLIIDRLTTLWTNFAKYSDPVPKTSDLLPVKWQPVTKEIRYYMNLDADMSLHKRPLSDKMAFWDLFYKMNWQYQKGYADI